MPDRLAVMSALIVTLSAACIVGLLSSVVLVGRELSHSSVGFIVLCVSSLLSSSTLVALAVQACAVTSSSRRQRRSNTNRRRKLSLLEHMWRVLLRCVTGRRKPTQTAVMTPAEQTGQLLAKMRGTPQVMKAMEATMEHSFINSNTSGSLEYDSEEIQMCSASMRSFRSRLQSDRSTVSFFSTRTHASAGPAVTSAMLAGSSCSPVPPHSPNTLAPKYSQASTQRKSAGTISCHSWSSQTTNKSLCVPKPTFASGQRKRSQSSADFVPSAGGLYIPGGSNHNTLVVPGLENIVIYRGRAYSNSLLLAHAKEKSKARSSCLEVSIECPPLSEEASKKSSASAPPTPIQRSRTGSYKCTCHMQPQPDCQCHHSGNTQHLLSPKFISRITFEEALRTNLQRKKSSVMARMETMVAIL